MNKKIPAIGVAHACSPVPRAPQAMLPASAQAAEGHARAPQLAALSPTEAAAVAGLRATMEAAGSAFEFVVCRVPKVDGQAPDATEAHHRAALQRLFDQLRADGIAYWQALIAREPQYAASQPPPLDADLAAAEATPLDASAVLPATRFAPGYRILGSRDVSSVTWFEWFAQAFDDPPYGLRLADAELHRTLFPRFCACTGLVPGDGIAVLDWVGHPACAPARSAWSSYFDDGREWWGIWCFTVWNPRHRTLSAIVASQTD